MLSKIIRRTHMYLALGLTPWIFIYAVSTIVMNHRELFRRLGGAESPVILKESERTYAGVFPDGARPQTIAQQILRDIGMDGAFNARLGKDGRLTIARLDPISPRRITFDPKDSRLTVEREVFRTVPYLERMHRRRGYQHPYALEDAWAVSVDAVILVILFWAASGIWMWWEMRLTRRLGALFAAGGAALFVLFLATI